MLDDTEAKEGDIGKLCYLQEEPWFEFGVYLAADKVAQCRLMADSGRDKKGTKK